MYRNLLLVVLTVFALFANSNGLNAAQTCVTRTYPMPDGNGGCCAVTIDYCYEVIGTVLVLTFGNVSFSNPQCGILMGPGLFNWLRKKVVYDLSRQQVLDIAICPATSPLSIKTSQSSCYKLEQTAPGVDLTYNPCGETYCVKECQVCLSTSETDPCSVSPANQPMLQYVGCQNQVVICVPDPTPGNYKCTINTCDSN